MDKKRILNKLSSLNRLDKYDLLTPEKIKIIRKPIKVNNKNQNNKNQNKNNQNNKNQNKNNQNNNNQNNNQNNNNQNNNQNNNNQNNNQNNKSKNKTEKIKKNKNPKISLKIPDFKINKNLNMNEFCKYNNKTFKKIYLFLKCPRNIFILTNTIHMLNHPKTDEIILKQIKTNKDKIYKMFKDFQIIMDYYKNNNHILKSQVGHFILYYDHNLTQLKTKNNADYLTFFRKIINYPKLISLLKEIFYILSDYRFCLYYSTPNINFKNTTKSTIDEFIQKFHSNQVILFSTISRIYPGSNSPWGMFYANAYASFESLLILQKYYKEPLKKIKIEFKYKKKNNRNTIIKKLENVYNIKLNKLEKIVNVSNYIILMKKLKYDMHEVVNSIFDIIYEGNTLKNIENSELISSIKLFKQKKNYELGTKIYILVHDNFISNVNCFENFSI